MICSNKEKVETALMIDYLKKNEPNKWRSIEILISSTYTLSNFKKGNKNVIHQK
ncbi:hypothetical protein IC216_14015 [Clostridioides sp. ES-S-0145-01]|uniref:hypothetical protein n=1 Tax=unclassified Clostridioides TaxID=2635829 RepID=UPI001D128FC5|nr:hypothetical protein [Clostridioides sp. ES-S-0145-01]MCC0697190.1 hypothetical protein [Clostridioides sp. ES-S-0048-02]